MQNLRLHLCRPSCNITDPILPSHGSAVCYFDFESLDFLSEFYPLAVCEWFSLFINVPDVQYFTHKFNYRLCFIKRSSRNCKTNTVNKQLERIRIRNYHLYSASFSTGLVAPIDGIQTIPPFHHLKTTFKKSQSTRRIAVYLPNGW